MSQVIKNLASGPVPPSVATSYVTQDGTAIPLANVLIVNGFSSDEDDDDGIITKGGVVGTGLQNELDVVITNRIQGSGTTTNNTLTTIATFDLGADPGVYYISGTIIGYDTTNVAGGCFPFEFAARTTGLSGIEIASEFVNEIYEDDFGYDTVQVEISGNNVVVQVQGDLATTIEWNTLSTYTFVG